MVETRAQAMANERMDKLEQTLQSIQTHLDRLTILISSVIPKGKEEAHEEAYIGNGHSEGESSHSPHLWGPQKQQSRPRPPKLDMHKFDGSHPAAWIAQMEQYFNLNNILDNETRLMVGACTWTLKGGNGGNGINVVVEVLCLRTPSKKLLQIALTRNILSLVILLSSDRRAQWRNMLHPLKP